MDPAVKVIMLIIAALSLFLMTLKADTVSTSSSSGDDYERTILRAYPGSPPFLMNYRQNELTVFTSSGAYLMQNFGVMKPSTETIQRLSPIVDRAGNIIFNDNRRTYYSQHSSGITYPVFTNRSHSTYQLAHDPRSNRVFIISRYSQSICASLRSVSRALFSFNSISPNIVRGKVMTREVKPLGRNLTAISIDQETGKMVLATEVYKPKSWNLILMEPVSSLKIRNVK